MCFDADNGGRSPKCGIRFPALPARPSDRIESRNNGTFKSCRRNGGADMSTSFTHRREFLKQAGLMGSLGSAAFMAGLPESAMAFGGGAAHIVEDEAVPLQTEDAP